MSHIPVISAPQNNATTLLMVKKKKFPLEGYTNALLRKWPKCSLQKLIYELIRDHKHSPENRIAAASLAHGDAKIYSTTLKELHLFSCSLLSAHSRTLCLAAFVASMMVINSHHMENVALIGQGLGMLLCGQTRQE